MRVSQLKGLWGFPKETKIWPLDCSSTSTRESQPALPDTPPMAPAKLGPQSHSHFLVLSLFTYIYWFLLLWLNPDTHSADYILKTVAGILLHSSLARLLWWTGPPAGTWERCPAKSQQETEVLRAREGLNPANSHVGELGRGSCCRRVLRWLQSSQHLQCSLVRGPKAEGLAKPHPQLWDKVMLIVA